MACRTVVLSSGPAHFIDEGTGPPILLLHGAPVTSLGFVRVVHELRSRFHVIAPDFPGFGGSAAEGFDGSLPAHSRFIRELCVALGLCDFYAYLNDASTCIGLHALPELGDRVAGLIVASSVPLPMSGRFRIVRVILKNVIPSAAVRYLNRKTGFLPWLVATVDPLHNPFTQTERHAMIAEFDTPAKRERILDLFSQMGRDDEFLDAAARRARHSLQSTPVLILYGQFDPMRLLGAIPFFERMFPLHTVRIIPREKHFPILGSGERVGQVVREWIESLK